MENLAQLAPLLILIPAVGAIINFFWGATLGDKSAGVIGSTAAAMSFLVALGLLSSIAIAASTRLGMLSTLLICLVALAAGLSADQVIKPLTEGPEATAWADALYRLVPNFQCFWMVDALSENRAIPWSYVASATGYGALYAAAGLLLGMALFETREVG